jgi:hypothetical protein
MSRGPSTPLHDIIEADGAQGKEEERMNRKGAENAEVRRAEDRRGRKEKRKEREEEGKRRGRSV